MALRIDDVDLQRDRMLVERFQEGDDTAFETLYRRYFARLQRFCLKRVGDPHEAEEIAQEAFTRAYRALPDLAGERRFYPWMTVIAGRLCVDHHRRRGRTEPAAVIELGVVEGGQEAIVEQADFALLSSALDRLAPRHREVLEMREHRGLSYQQIADHYEVPLGTVEALIFRARKALKREFLAVAGSERMGGFAALPVFGGLLRHWGAVKAKVAGWASALPPAVAPALGVAAVVGSAAVVGTAILPEVSGNPDRPPAVVRVVGTSPASSTTSLADATGAAASHEGHTHPATDDQAAPGGSSLTSGPVAVGSTPVADAGSAADGHARSEDQDVEVASVGDTVIRIDVIETAEDLADYLIPGSQE